MKAIVLERYGGPDVLEIKTIPDPKPQSGEVLVSVYATALNRADLVQRKGNYPPPDPKPKYEIPGLEFAGVIESVGPNVVSVSVGDRVCGLLPGGGYAEKVVVPERMLIPIPETLSFLEAAAIPEVYLTAYDALANKAKLIAGNSVLIHGGGSGLGTALIQLAKVKGASKIYCTAGSQEKIQKLISILSVDRAINYTHEDFCEVIHNETNGRGVDVIVDIVGAPYLEKNIDAAATDGRIVFLATLGGAQEKLNIRTVMYKRLSLFGATLRARPIEQKMILTQTFIKHMLPFFADGKLKPIIDSIFPFEDIARAHQYMESNKNFGKVVIQISA